ncbi:MAG: hypothetical protein EOO73_00035 [Myxococcales bacterium]|nr:MAG: hypothetical protein EOO73_00035 [Myxococcales bacterium]
MDKKPKPPEPQQEADHPEIKQPPQRLPGDQSSKVSTKQGDARTGHDKDGNEERARTGRAS